MSACEQLLLAGGVAGCRYDGKKVPSELVNAYRRSGLVRNWEDGMLRFLACRVSGTPSLHLYRPWQLTARFWHPRCMPGSHGCAQWGQLHSVACSAAQQATQLLSCCEAQATAEPLPQPAAR